MVKKQKPANMAKPKSTKDQHAKQSTSMTVNALLEQYSNQSNESIDSVIDNLFSQPIKESLFELVSCLFEYIGIRQKDDLRDDQNLTAKKNEYVQNLIQKANLKLVKESTKRKAFQTFLYKVIRSAFPSDDKSNKKIKPSFFNDLTDWLICLTGCKARKVRVETSKLLLSIVIELVSEPGILEKQQFKSFFNYLSSQFILPRLKDIDNTIKHDLLNFIVILLDKADQIFEPSRGSDGYQYGNQIMMQSFLIITDTSYDLRTACINLIIKSLNSQNQEVSMQMLNVFKTNKNLMINSILDAGTKEVELYLSLFKDLIQEKDVFENEDINKLSLLVYHHYKKIAALATEFWSDIYGMKKFHEEEQIQEKLMKFCVFLQNIYKNRFEDVIMDEYIDLGLKFVPYISIGSKAQEMIELFEVIIGKSHVKTQKQTVYVLIGLLVAIAFDRNQKNEEFVEKHVNEHFDSLLKNSQKFCPHVLEGFIQLYRFQAIIDKKIEFEGRITQINNLLNDTREMSLIKAVYGLYYKYRTTDKVRYQLENNYITYKKILDSFFDPNINYNDSKYLLCKIRLVIKECLILKNVYTDFGIVFKIINDYLNEKLQYDIEYNVKTSLGIIYEMFYSDFLKLFKVKEDFEQHMATHRERRIQVFSIFEQFMTYKPMRSDVSVSSRAAIRIEAFNLLINTYMLVSKDSMQNIYFIYNQPGNPHLNRLIQFVNQYLFSDKRYGSILQTEHKRQIKGEIEDSQNNEYIEEEEENKNENFIDEETSTPMINEKNDENNIQSYIYKENFVVYKFVCSKFIELLKTCSNAFEGQLAHIIVVKFFMNDKTKTLFRPMLQDYLKFLLTKDINSFETNSFWSCYLRTLLLEEEPIDYITYSRFFAKCYLTLFTSKSTTKEQQTTLFRNFLNCMLSIFRLSLTNKNGFNFIEVLKNVFMREPFFKENISLLKNLLYKFCMVRKNHEKTLNLTPELISKFESLENHIAKMVGLFNKDNIIETKIEKQDTDDVLLKKKTDIVKDANKSITDIKEKNIKVGDLDDGYRIKRKAAIKEESMKEAYESGNFDQRRSIRF